MRPLMQGTHRKTLDPRRFRCFASKRRSRIFEIIENGRGFAVVRGWPLERHDYQKNLLAFCGIAAYFGEAKVQNYKGEPIVNVIDKEKPYDHIVSQLNE